MGTSGQKIRRFYYTRYRNSEQQIFASQYENIQLKFISQQGFPFTFSQPLLTKTGTEIYPLFGQTSGPVLPVPGRSISIVWEQDGSPLHGQAGRPEGQSPFGSGFPIGASSIPVGTRLSPESLVCYTFVEQMAAGIVAHPGKFGYSCGVLAGKVAPCGAA